MFLSFLRKKRKDIFFEYFILVVKNIQLASQVFREELHNLKDAEQFALQIKTVENMGDQYTHEIIMALNKTFITPLEREDILDLTIKLDDILDLIEACAWSFDLFNISEPDEYMKLFARNIEMCTQEIVYAINYLVEKKLPEITRHTHKINDLENVADDLLRDSLKTLFSTCTDPIELIKRKEIYHMMEEVTDACEDVANILEGIIMRNS
ncbi:phosphate transport regulator [Pelotomaculum thermopropionicum SI]|uniref:Phosphate transport regulator n=1 Tax=Pelotomaculum thermopropionicum (strain DSM 13744 / JCM 10971 / SI) TaxID=370438 RepID=A5D0L2_PELTS|nr:phosphate transport regulator [Pelotomaculum thermopropionicum SI]